MPRLTLAAKDCLRQRKDGILRRPYTAVVMEEDLLQGNVIQQDAKEEG